LPEKLGGNKFMTDNDEKVIIPEIVEKENNKEADAGVGCLRGIIIFVTGLAFSFGLGIIVSLQAGIIYGILAAGLLFVVITALAIYMANTAKKLTVTDCVLPLIISIISAVIFSPFMLLTLEVFSIFTCIGAGFFMSLGLFLYRAKIITGYWLIIPAIVFAYEILPINIPAGGFDDIFALGGSAGNFMVRALWGMVKFLQVKGTKEKGYSLEDKE